MKFSWPIFNYLITERSKFSKLSLNDLLDKANLIYINKQMKICNNNSYVAYIISSGF